MLVESPDINPKCAHCLPPEGLLLLLASPKDDSLMVKGREQSMLFCYGPVDSAGDLTIKIVSRGPFSPDTS